MAAIYLDNNATTPMDPEVLASMMPYFSEQFGNASSAHGFGAAVSPAVREARRAVRDLIGAALDQEVIFTSGGTESDNTAILSALDNNVGRNEVIVSAVEHPAMLSLCAHLERHRATPVHRIPVDGSGRLDIDAYRAALGPRTAVVSFMWANNETGTLFPVVELAKLARASGPYFTPMPCRPSGSYQLILKQHPSICSLCLRTNCTGRRA